MMKSPAILAAVLVAVSLVGPALADVSPATKKEADEHFDKGNALMEAGDTAEACREFGKSVAIERAGGAVLNLGLCEESVGHYATAQKLLTEALELAKRKNRADRIKTATQHLAGIEKKISYLSVRTPAGEDVLVLLDEQPVPGSEIEKGIAVDPGVHGVKITAKGMKPWESTVTVGAVADRKELVVPALEPLATLKPKTPESKPTASSPETIAVAPDTGSGRTAAYVLGGVSLVGFGVGTAFVLRAESLKDSPDRADARSAQLIARIGMGVGVVAAGAAVWVFLTSKPESRPAPTSTAVAVTPMVGTAWGLGVQGGF